MEGLPPQEVQLGHAAGDMNRSPLPLTTAANQCHPPTARTAPRKVVAWCWLCRDNSTGVFPTCTLLFRRRFVCAPKTCGG